MRSSLMKNRLFSALFVLSTVFTLQLHAQSENPPPQNDPNRNVGPWRVDGVPMSPAVQADITEINQESKIALALLQKAETLPPAQIVALVNSLSDSLFFLMGENTRENYRTFRQALLAIKKNPKAATLEVIRSLGRLQIAYEQAMDTLSLDPDQHLFSTLPIEDTALSLFGQMKFSTYAQAVQFIREVTLSDGKNGSVKIFMTLLGSSDGNSEQLEILIKGLLKLAMNNRVVTDADSFFHLLETYIEKMPDVRKKEGVEGSGWAIRQLLQGDRSLSSALMSSANAQQASMIIHSLSQSLSLPDRIEAFEAWTQSNPKKGYTAQQVLNLMQATRSAADYWENYHKEKAQRSFLGSYKAPDLNYHPIYAPLKRISQSLVPAFQALNPTPEQTAEFSRLASFQPGEYSRLSRYPIASADRARPAAKPKNPFAASVAGLCRWTHTKR